MMEQGTPSMQELTAEVAALQEEISFMRAKRNRGRGRRTLLLILVAGCALIAGLVATGDVAGMPPTVRHGASGGHGVVGSPTVTTANSLDPQPLVVKVGNGEAMSLAPSEYLGVGTSSPTSKLDVNGSIHSSGAITTTGALAAGGDLKIAGDGTVTGTLNAIGGLHENGTSLRSTYVALSGSYSDPAWIKSLAGTKISGPVANAGSAHTAAAFTGNLSGDVTGTQSSTTVSKLHGVAVSGNSPGDGQVLQYHSDSSQWAPTDLPKGLPKLTFVTKNDSASINGGHAFGKVFCPSGTRVIGGGVTGSTSNAYIAESAPDPGNNSWDYFVTNTDSLSADSVQIWAICA